MRVTVRVKLKATVVNRLGDALADTISAQSYQHTLAKGARSDPDDDDSVETFELPKTGDIVGGQYRLADKLGAGMFGSVYVAERTDVPEHRVALKLVNRDVYGDRDVERELVMLAAATHPNIVELKDHGMTDAYVWLTMPLYEGETLTERLERGTLGLREAYEILLPIVRGVEALHARGLRHQDIKPENIYLASFATQLHPVLLDLGVAVEKDADFVAGTALYGSPEQLAALGGIGTPGALTERMDTYCLASTLLYALVGEDAFPGSGARTPFDITNAIEQRANEPLREGTLAELQGRPRELLIEAFQRWLKPHHEDRPSAGEMAGELEVLLEKEREEQREEQRRVRRQKTNLQRLSFALVASLIIVGAGITYGISKSEMLALAGELEEAREEGAKSFDKLSTCTSEYSLSQHSVRRCSNGRDADAREHQAVVSELETDKTRLNNSLGGANKKLRGCAEEAKTAAETCDAERQTLITEHGKEVSSWVAARTSLEQERDQKEAARLACESETTRLQSELAACKAPVERPGLRPVPRPTSPPPPTPVEPITP
jgi:serine/threonine protein kinase